MSTSAWISGGSLERPNHRAPSGLELIYERNALMLNHPCRLIFVRCTEVYSLARSGASGYLRRPKLAPGGVPQTPQVLSEGLNVSCSDGSSCRLKFEEKVSETITPG